MSLSLPKTFHVESLQIPTCKNPECSTRVTSESCFCPDCWALLRRETQRKIARAQCTRNQRCILRYVNRGARELSKQQGKDNAVSMPSGPAPAAGSTDRPGHHRERGLS